MNFILNLSQGVDIQLGMAIDSTKATLAVKRRLACEMVKYWQQVWMFPTNMYEFHMKMFSHHTSV